MTREPFRTALMAMAVIYLGFATVGQAEEVKASGRVAYVPHSSESFELPDGRTGQRLHSKGTVIADDASANIHLSTQDCSGTYVFAAGGTTFSASGYCDGIDRDGDIWWIWWKGDQVGSTWGFLGGTGKFEGVEGGGTTKNESQSPDGRIVISWEGTWTMK